MGRGRKFFAVFIIAGRFALALRFAAGLLRSQEWWQGLYRTNDATNCFQLLYLGTEIPTPHFTPHFFSASFLLGPSGRLEKRHLFALCKLSVRFLSRARDTACRIAAATA